MQRVGQGGGADVFLFGERVLKENKNFYMDKIHPKLKEHFDYWMEQLGPDDPFLSGSTIGIKEVLRAHYLLVDYFSSTQNCEGVGGIGPRDKNLLPSTLSRQFTGFAGQSKWSSPLEVCSTLFYGLIKNHPFHDANKRTGLLTLIYHLGKVGRTINAPQKEFENFTVMVASNRLSEYKGYNELKRKGDDADILTIARFLKRATRQVDKRFYLITYRELDTILRKFGYGLENLKNNHIDIVKYEKKRRYGFVGPKEEYLVKIGQIGMPNWKTQVGTGAISTVRKVTKLDAAHGTDSAVFFHGADTLGSLISSFEGPLRRLADK
jgi:death-on-curing family protein